MYKYLIALVIVFSQIQIAHSAGLLSLIAKEILEVEAKDQAKKGVVKEGIKQGAKSTAAKETTKQAAKKGSKKALNPQTIAAGVGVTGLLATVGLIANDNPVEQDDVNQEIAKAVSHGRKIYESSVCYHPVKHEYYPVAAYAAYCPNGDKPVKSAKYVINIG